MPVDPQEQRLKEAAIAHAQRLEIVKLHFNQSLAFAVDFMKAPALVAAAGIAAALGFYSANYSRLSQSPEKLLLFNDILYWLFLSLLLTVVAPGLAYLSQNAYIWSMNEEEYSDEPPFVHRTTKSKIARWMANFYRGCSGLLIFAALVCLALGGSLFLQIVR